MTGFYTTKMRYFCLTPRKFDKFIYASIIRANIVTSHEVDLHLARMIDHSFAALRFAIALITECCLDEFSFCPFTDFLHTINIVRSSALSDNASEDISTFIDMIDKKSALFSINCVMQNSNPDPIELKRALGFVFDEWIEIAAHPGAGFQTQNDFVVEVFLIN